MGMTDSLSTESDALLRIQDRTLPIVSLSVFPTARIQLWTNLPHKRLDTAGTAIDLVESDLSDHGVAVFPIVRRQNDVSEIPRGVEILTCGVS